MVNKIYLRSYDLYTEVLEYDRTTGDWAILSREMLEKLGIAPSFGKFTREGSEVMGVFATPDGPVFFLGKRSLSGRHGEITASVETRGDGRDRRFVLYRGAELEFIFDYSERYGIGTNPYDNEPEDVDLAAWIARGIPSEAFFRLFTKD